MGEEQTRSHRRCIKGWNLKKLRKSAVVHRWFRLGGGVGNAGVKGNALGLGLVVEYVELSAKTVVSYRRYSKNMNSLDNQGAQS